MINNKTTTYRAPQDAHEVVCWISSLNDVYGSWTGDEDDDEQHRFDAKPPQVKRRQSVFAKLGSNRQKKVSACILCNQSSVWRALHVFLVYYTLFCCSVHASICKYCKKFEISY